MIGFRSSKVVPASFLLLALALAVAGCGRRGALEPPPGAPEAPPRAAPVTPGGAPVAPVTTSLRRPGTTDEPLAEDIVRPDRPFFLDFLL